MANLNSENDYDQLCVLAIKASIEAGKAILRHYSSDYSIDYKEDKSPLTIADRDSHKVISEYLSKTDIPILSEEGRSISYDERKLWKQFWLVDPLDGTKEFINHNGEFTVNIALIEDSGPVIGVIYIPVSDVLYFATEKRGSYKLELRDQIENLNKENTLPAFIALASKLPIELERPVTIIGSRSHQNPDNTLLINKISELYNEVQIINAGSSLKFCKVAEGLADYYPRLGPTMEWDTAAGDAIARFAGAKVFENKSQANLVYNKENLLNPDFLVIAAKHFSTYLEKL